MAERIDPTSPVTTDPGSGIATAGLNPPVTDGSSPTDVSGTAPDPEVARERLRRSREERAHQREKSELTSRIDQLETLVKQAVSGQPTPPNIEEIQRRLDSPDSTVVKQAMKDMAVAVGQWTNYQADQQRRQRVSLEVEDAIADLHADHPDIPRSALDTSSPDAVQSSAERYLREQRVKSLEDEVAALKSGKTAAEEAGALAATRARQELGGTRTLTSTGTAPAAPSATQEEIAQLEQEAGRLKRLRTEEAGARLMLVNRRLTQARQELASAAR